MGVSVNNTTLYFIYNKVICQGDMFRPLLGHLQALWENRSKNYIHFNAMWDTLHWNVHGSWICFLRRPEDDL